MAKISIRVSYVDGSAATGINVYVRFMHWAQRIQMTQRFITNWRGSAAIEYDDQAVEPVEWAIQHPFIWMRSGQIEWHSDLEVTIDRISGRGPLGWWHRSLGIREYDPNLGNGIRVGVIDTGCCRSHPNLKHVTHLGQVSNGKMTYGEPEHRGIHGTHVCGIVGAKPPVEQPGSGFAGIAPGVELFTIKVDLEHLREKEDSYLSEEDKERMLVMSKSNINEAISVFAKRRHVDLINLSLTTLSGSPVDLRNDILRETIKWAASEGTLCIAAAGNDGDYTVAHPASLPEVVAVSAVGLLGTGPQYEPDMYLPSDRPQCISASKHYLSSISNYGEKILCCGPGVGIVSTVPIDRDHPAPYLDLTGTSMAAPMVTAALAVHLSKEISTFRALPPHERPKFAMDLLERKICKDLHLETIFQGKGMVQAT